MTYRYELKRYTVDAEEAEDRQWHTAWREGDCLNVRIMGQINSNGIEELLAQFSDEKTSDVKTCKLHLRGVKGVHGSAVDRLGECLEALGRDNVTCSVRGFCRSGGILLLCWSGFVSAAADTEFCIHASYLGFTRENFCDEKLGEVIDRYFDKRCDQMAAVLRKRITNPERFLNGRDHPLDAQMAKMIGLVDELETQQTP